MSNPWMQCTNTVRIQMFEPSLTDRVPCDDIVLDCLSNRLQQCLIRTQQTAGMDIGCPSQLCVVLGDCVVLAVKAERARTIEEHV